MSGDGRPLPCVGMASARDGMEERADVLAFLRRRLGACEMMATRNADEAERAGVMKRQLLVLIDEIGGGMHEGEAAIALRRLDEKEV